MSCIRSRMVQGMHGFICIGLYLGFTSISIVMDSATYERSKAPMMATPVLACLYEQSSPMAVCEVKTYRLLGRFL